MLAAGGTGGHLFPAQALAQELARRAARVDLITDERGHRYGSTFPATHIYEVPSASLSLSLSPRNFIGAWRIMRGIVRAQRILQQTRPEVIIGFGGYPSLPPLAAAVLEGIPILIHEQNAVLGRVNRLLARFAATVATGFPELKNASDRVAAKTRCTGNPVRDEVLALKHAAYDPPKVKGDVRLLVFGGSQGAKVFADIVPAAVLEAPASFRKRLKIAQQCRIEDMARVREAYAQAGVDAEIAPFFNSLPQRMANAHLVIARSGASTVGELSMIGRPAILVPLPHAIDNDQLHNARHFVLAGGGWLVEQRDFTPDQLSALLFTLCYSPEDLASAAQAAAALARDDAVTGLADIVEKLARGRSDDAHTEHQRKTSAWPEIGQVKWGDGGDKESLPDTPRGAAPPGRAKPRTRAPNPAAPPARLRKPRRRPS